MVRVGLWTKLVHHLMTLNTEPILGLRLAKPILVLRYSKFDVNTVVVYIMDDISRLV